MDIQTLADRKKHILLLMEYAVPEKQQDKALETLALYETDIIALNLIEAFYSYLPEARDDAILSLRLIKRRQGNFLICATTVHDHYIYIVSAEKTEFLGNTAEGIWDEEILAYYGYADRQAFIKACADLKQYEEYHYSDQDEDICPACAVSPGENHTFGCPVEICPWCGGQLVQCKCRYELLDVEVFNEDAHVEDFRRLLEEKGRIAYDATQQRPNYMSKELLNRLDEE